MHRLVLATLLFVTSASLAGDASFTAQEAEAFFWLAPEARRARVAGMSKAELTALFDAASEDTLLAVARRDVDLLSTYSATLVKQERVDGKLLPAQTIEVFISHEPFMARLDVTDGPSKGRRVLYNSTLNDKQLRAREPGVKGILGAFWIDRNSSLTRSDTNYAIVDLGLEPVLRYYAADAQKAKKFGGFKRTNLGLDARGDYCMKFDAPPGARGLQATESRICLEPATLVPSLVEVVDSGGLLGRFKWSDVKPRTFEKDFFTPEKCGL